MTSSWRYRWQNRFLSCGTFSSVVHHSELITRTTLEEWRTAEHRGQKYDYISWLKSGPFITQFGLSIRQILFSVITGIEHKMIAKWNLIEYRSASNFISILSIVVGYHYQLLFYPKSEKSKLDVNGSISSRRSFRTLTNITFYVSSWYAKLAKTNQLINEKMTSFYLIGPSFFRNLRSITSNRL